MRNCEGHDSFVLWKCFRCVCSSGGTVEKRRDGKKKDGQETKKRKEEERTGKGGVEGWKGWEEGERRRS